MSDIPSATPKYLIFHNFRSQRSGFEIPRDLQGFAAMRSGTTLCRGRFRIAATRESRPLSHLASDVVEYQNDAALAREHRIVFCFEDQTKPSA